MQPTVSIAKNINSNQGGHGRMSVRKLSDSLLHLLGTDSLTPFLFALFISRRTVAVVAPLTSRVFAGECGT